MVKWVLFLILNLFSFSIFSQDKWTIYGTITDKENNVIELANIRVQGSDQGTVSDKNGNYKLSITEKKDVVLIFWGLGFIEKKVSVVYHKENIKLDIVLENDDEKLSEVQITDQRAKENGLMHIEPLLLNNIPNISGNSVQTFIKTLPGVASANELSSTYSVRGGNFDENLVYINGIEVFKPMLLQSGQQEGLDMVNADLVSKVEFSSGGFSAKYGDKMSSVLDIHYKKPSEFKASTSLSLLGATAHIEGSQFKQKFTYLMGLRYKNSQYLLNSLETQGEYKPNFLDFQSVLGYESKKLSVSLLTYITNNNYLFYPSDRSTSFGTSNEALNLYVAFDGSEKDKFTSYMGGLTFDYKPSNKLGMKLNISAYSNSEALTYDIEGRYSLNQLDKQIGSSTFGDSILNLGIGKFIEHARSYLDAIIANVNYTGWLEAGNNYIQWGTKYQHENVKDKVNEWQMMDSAGYSVPNHEANLELAQHWYSNNSLIANSISSFFQVNYKVNGTRDWNIEYGARLFWRDVNRQFLISPRVSFGIFPLDNKKFYLRFGSGYYYQPLFYREMIDKEGIMYKNIETPYSIHYTASGEYDFKMLDRPFHFKAELYYKSLKNLTPYSVDNIRINYYPGQTAKGYASGLDLRLNGEFVPETESWLSLSLMKSAINIAGDTIGNQPLPNDHLVNVSLFFQDYIPGNKRLKMYLALYFLSGLPFGPPNNETYYAPFRMPAYKRADIGFSIVLKQEDKKTGSAFINNFKNILLNLEVFNLLGINNTISYNWITVVPNSSVVGNNGYASFAVPNRLSARRFNVRLSMDF